MTLINIERGGKATDISELVSSVTWSGDIRQASRKLEIDLAIGRDNQLPKYNIPLGSLLVFENNGKELFRGIVFNNKKDTDNKYSITSYDHLIYLLKSTGTYIFRKMTATNIIKKLCNDFGIPLGGITNTGVVLDKLILRNMSIYDMCIVALTETSKRNGKKYHMYMEKGKLYLKEKAEQLIRWVISEGNNLQSASYSESIDDMRNKIVIMGDKDKVLATVEDKSLIRQYGLLQELQEENDINSHEANTIAKNLLKKLGKVSKKASISCLGIDDVVAGSAIEVKESLTGLVGTFYVDTDKHKFENGQHFMDLKLNWTDEVANKEYTEVVE